MEVFLGLVLFLLIAVPLALSALARVNSVSHEVDTLRNDVRNLEAGLSALGKRVSTDRASPTPRPTAESPSAGAAAPGAPIPSPPPVVAPSSPHKPSAPEPPRLFPLSPPPPPAPDLATNLGPKILVAVGALAVVVALGFFVKYAWENEWVGPTGRVLFGCFVSLAMITAGLRLVGREYRPLGQGLTGAGLAGLYTSVYGAYGFYALIPREAAFVLLVAVTAAAILLSARLAARLLAALAWVGGYLTPFLLSTGEDKAFSLFLYLFLLGAGALVLDNSKPWPETAPIAMIGTLVLYGAWYAQFISPQRFDVAAFGIALFTALFAVGMARKGRQAGLVSVYLLGAFGLTALAGVANRPGTLALLSIALAAAALHAAARAGWGMSVVSGIALALPYVVWCGQHAKDMSFGMGAAWLVAATLLYVLTAASGRVPLPIPLEAVALAVSGAFTIVLSNVPERPLPLLALLLAQAGVSLLAQRRWDGAELTGLVAAAVSILATFDRFFKPEHEGWLLLLALPVFGVYLVALVVRGLVQRTIGDAGVASHLVNAAFLWTVLHRVYYETSPGILAMVSLGLALLYLVLGVAILRGPAEEAHARVALGLAAAFVTIAIPVQLGLNGITLAWAAEGVVLLALGVRFVSPLARAGGYLVLAMTVVRLFARHIPLHPGEFLPFLNPSFATWLAVIAALALGLYVARVPRQAREAPDAWVGPALSALVLALLFGVLTAETRGAFGQREAMALRIGDVAGVQHAQLMGGLAVSVLWSAFATALLGFGLGIRSRPLFYTAYALFAMAAGKVALVDLAELQTLYRIVSFLALGVLLMAGAYLNIRFRERLLPGEALQ